MNQELRMISREIYVIYLLYVKRRRGKNDYVSFVQLSSILYTPFSVQYYMPNLYTFITIRLLYYYLACYMHQIL